MVGTMTEPDTPLRRSAKNNRLGSGTPSMGGAEAVLHGTQQTQRMMAITFERKHGVDDVLKHARTSEATFFGDVANKNN